MKPTNYTRKWDAHKEQLMHILLKGFGHYEKAEQHQFILQRPSADLASPLFFLLLNNVLLSVDRRHTANQILTATDKEIMKISQLESKIEETGK